MKMDQYLDENDEELLNIFGSDKEEDNNDSADELLNLIEEKECKSVKKEKDFKDNIVKNKISKSSASNANQGSIKRTGKVKDHPKNVLQGSGDDFTFCGIKVITPKVSMRVLQSRTESRKIVKISKIETTMRNNDIEGDWVTIGVLVKKLPLKKASNGNNFSVWQLSDFGNGTENDTIGFFLFGNVCKEYWKHQVGTVIGLLNPTIMKQEKDSDRQLSITIDNPKNLMEIGIAKDLGVCKGIRKSDGRKCNMFVNRYYGDFCEYHVQRQFKKAKGERMELQSGGLGPEVKKKRNGKLMQNLKKDISHGSIYYGGKTVFLSDKSKQQVKLQSTKNVGGLRGVMGTSLMASADKDLQELKRIKEKEKLERLQGGSDEFKELLGCPTIGARNLMRHLKGNQVKEEEVTAPKKKVDSAKGFLKENKTELLPSKSKHQNNSMNNVDKLKNSRKLSDISFFENNSINKTSPTLGKNNISNRTNKNIIGKENIKFQPKLGRGFSKSQDLLIGEDDDGSFNYDCFTGEEVNIAQPRLNPANIKDSDLNKNMKNGNNLSAAKRKAIALIKMKGQIEKEDPNEVPGKCKKRKSLEILEKVENSNIVSETEKSPSTKKRKSLLAGALGSIDIKSDEMKKLLKQKSKNVGVLQMAEAEREERYFNTLEKKERMEEKMLSIFEIKVTGIACRICQYLSDSRSKFCIDENHNVAKIPNVIKRFFKCKQCKTRCNSFNKLIPKNPCRNCGERNFEKVSMANERKGPELESEKLEIRGIEKKFLLQM